MKLCIQLSDYCSGSVISKAETIVKGGSIRSEALCGLSDGTWELRSRAVDSFHFVDHPRLRVSSDGDEILSFHCDCPQFRSTREMCPHCAALALKFNEGIQPTRSSVTTATAVVAPAPTQAQPLPEVVDFSYAFCNSGRDLYPGVYKPEIPLKRFIQVFGDNNRARDLYEAYRPWGGSCFGMTVSSTMFYIPHSGIRMEEFDPNAKYPSQLSLSQRSDSLGMTLHEFIEAGLILQSSDGIMSERFHRMRSPDCLKELCDAVERFQETGENPVCIGVWDADYQGGHSVLPYRLDRTDGAEDILHIYDPNCPMQVRYAYFEKDAQGRYINWRFPMYNDYPYSNKTGGYITFDRYETYKKAWDRRGSPDVHVLLTVESGTSLLDGSGNTLAGITQSGIDTDAADIFPHLPTGIGKKKNHTVCAPVAPYILRNDDGRQELTLRATHIHQSVAVQTEGREAAILVDDDVQTQYVAISQPDMPYSITLTSSLEGSWAEVKLEGITGSNGIRIAQHRGALYCSPLCEDVPVSLYVNGEPENTAILRNDIDEIFQISEEDQPDLLTNTDKHPDEADA